MKDYKETRTLAYYLQLNYPVTVYKAEEGGYVAEIEDLPGCITEGETLEEVAKKIDNVRIAWLETAYEDSIDIPMPRTEEEYSGKFLIRIPKYLHRRLAETADREGVSLNQYVGSLLAGGISTHGITEEITTKLDGISRQFITSQYAVLHSLGVDYWEASEIEQEPLERQKTVAALWTAKQGVAA